MARQTPLSNYPLAGVICAGLPHGTGDTMPAALFALAAILQSKPASTAAPLLELENRLPLGSVRGRLDHLAYDADHDRIFVAEVDNGSVSVVDRASRKVIHRFEKLPEPQGLGWLPDTQTLYVACGDGKVRAFRGGDFSPAGEVDLGEDADNVHVERTSRRVFVGYGKGALAALDGVTLRIVGKARLHGHPEGFQLAAQTNKVFANVPQGNELVEVDLGRDRTLASWPMGVLHDNYPMALDHATQRIFIAARRPPTLAAFSMVDGRPLATKPTCRDADDLYFDNGRKRIYVICGEGFVDIRDPALAALGRFKTMAGARTALFVTDIDRLFVAVRAQGSESAAVWVLAPRN